MKKIYLLIILIISPLLSNTMIIDASNWDLDAWTYLNLNLGAIVDPNPSSRQNNLGWDLAFQRYHIRTNSGLSGVGNGGAFISSNNPWDNISYGLFNEVSENSFFIRDSIINTFYDIQTHQYISGIANSALETWATVGSNFQMQPTNNQFIVRSADGQKFYKIWISNYYNENGESGFITITFDEINSCSIGHDDCGECGGDNMSCTGCMDESALNYDQMASINNQEICDYLILGDINNDGELNILDLVFTVDIVLNNEYNSNGDINQDGILNILDLVEMVNSILD